MSKTYRTNEDRELRRANRERIEASRLGERDWEFPYTKAGHRYGNKRKAEAKDKVRRRRGTRRALENYDVE